MKIPFGIALVLALATPAAATADWASARLESALAAYEAGDYRVARQGFQRLAEHGSAVAETMLGVMYSEGKGVPVNHAVAAAWFHRAASRGYGPAQVAISDAFAQGRGVAKDTREAFFWALAATAGGDRSAETSGRARARKLAELIPSDEREQIAEDVHNWRPRAQRQR